MKHKTIRTICHKKIKAWIDSVDDPIVKKAIEENAFITGGAIASMFLREEVNDFDIYFRTKESLKIVVEHYAKVSFNGVSWAAPGRDCNGEITLIDGADWQGDFDLHSEGIFARQVSNIEADRIKLFIYEGIKRLEGKTDAKGNPIPFHPVYFSPNAITLSDDLQIVVRFWGEPSEIHKNYDFVHATNVYDYRSRTLITNEQALISLLTKELKYIGSLYPVTSVIRAKKFVTRHWTIGAGEYLKIIYQCGELDLNDIDVLEEQLVGVDVAYFAKLIDALRRNKESDDNFQVSQGFLFELIDNIFDQDDNSHEGHD